MAEVLRRIESEEVDRKRILTHVDPARATEPLDVLVVGERELQPGTAYRVDPKAKRLEVMAAEPQQRTN